MEPGGWCPLAGDNPESSAPRGACRQEGVSLHRERGGTKSSGVSRCPGAEEKDKKRETSSLSGTSPGI